MKSLLAHQTVKVLKHDSYFFRNIFSKTSRKKMTELPVTYIIVCSETSQKNEGPKYQTNSYYRLLHNDVMLSILF